MPIFGWQLFGIYAPPRRAELRVDTTHTLFTGVPGGLRACSSVSHFRLFGFHTISLADRSKFVLRLWRNRRRGVLTTAVFAHFWCGVHNWCKSAVRALDIPRICRGRVMRVWRGFRYPLGGPRIPGARWRFLSVANLVRWRHLRTPGYALFARGRLVCDTRVPCAQHCWRFADNGRRI